MFKKLLIAALIALPMTVAAQTTAKFATVDADQIFTAMPEAKTADEQLKKASDQYATEFKKLQDEFDKKYTEFQQQEKDTTVPDGIKERRMQELQELQDKMQKFQQTAQQDLQRQQQQLMAPIQEKILLAVKAIGSEEKYTMILPAGMAIYVGDTVTDITPKVKTRLGIK